jgi:hypothetical protein
MSRVLWNPAIMRFRPHRGTVGDHSNAAHFIDQADERAYHSSSAWSILAADQIAPAPRETKMIERFAEPGDFVIAHGLPLERLYARFDAMADGMVSGEVSTAHQSVMQHHAANQRRAAAHGWTGFVLERRGGSGRLELLGLAAPGRDLELVPDQIPYDGHQ